MMSMSPGNHDVPVKQAELSLIHDFAAKLTQPSVVDRLRAYVLFQRDYRLGRSRGDSHEALLHNVPALAPLSINLDLTTACNYRCDHCVDFDILNKPTRYDDQCLFDSLAVLAEHGLRSVIIIGGGEPTLYPRFAAAIRHLKSLRLKVGIVTNGGRLDRVLEVADALEAGDWVRLSLDAGTDATFQAMHRPRRPITLEQICSSVPLIKQANPRVSVGFSYIVVWRGCTANDAAIHENVDEMVSAARLAKEHSFDYISFKPFLTRAEENNAEVVGLVQQSELLEQVVAAIRRNVDEAKELNDDRFTVVESTNLKVLENGTYRNYTEQTRNCHMTFFRQVMSPLGLYNCPVYRNVPQAKVGQKDGYATHAELVNTSRRTLHLIDSFNASAECREVTCLYNHANWFIEDLIEHPDKLDELEDSAERHDYFL